MPDRFTAEWWRLQFEGVCHTNNLLSAKLVDQEKRFQAVWKRLEEVEAERREMAAKFGELTNRLDKASQFVKELPCKTCEKKAV